MYFSNTFFHVLWMCFSLAMLYGMASASNHWERNATKIFIENLQKHCWLFNPKHKNYKNRNNGKESFCEIAKQVSYVRPNTTGMQNHI